MRILLVNKRYPPHIGGIERHVQDLAQGLSSRPGVDVEVVVVGENAAGSECDGPVRVRRVRGLGTVASNPLSLGLLPLLAESTHDVWHFHYPFPTGELSFLLSHVARRFGAEPGSAVASPAVICTYHSDLVGARGIKRSLPAPYGVLTRRFLAACDRVVVASPQMVQHSPFVAAVAAKTRIIPYGLDPYALQLRPGGTERVAQLRAAYGTPLTLFVGRLVPYKGVDVLLRALPYVSGTVVLVGEGPLRAALARSAAALGVADRVRFVGALAHDELVAHLHAADVMVLPSVTRNEAFGLVQLESHACGVPVVSTDLPSGVPFANQHGETGVVVRPGDPLALAAALSLLLEDGALRARLGRQARDRFMREFTLDTMISRMLSLYAEVVPGE
ncbi:MAG: glycosyltransferase [Actinobacteria bacterium]|nr:glycosyltransferase [Actinomycetota bacterium]